MDGEAFLYLSGIFCILICAHCSLSFARHHWGGSGSVFFTPSHQVLVHIITCISLLISPPRHKIPHCTIQYTSIREGIFNAFGKYAHWSNTWENTWFLSSCFWQSLSCWGFYLIHYEQCHAHVRIPLRIGLCGYSQLPIQTVCDRNGGVFIIGMMRNILWQSIWLHQGISTVRVNWKWKKIM